ncbi:MAG: hypothetical protein JO316_16275 [Abitibacteriaceae bacterium]|nr:hypothetical protein [Abditibacteriaceae bacterium]MBV9866910.1 hypothetical protein [Abditibacteriaceae bacterium]
MMRNPTDIWLQVLLRVLPSIILLGLAFIAATDRKTREQWANLLYQVGSIRPDQREDPKIQQGVRVPFFILSALLLIWPVYYYLWITRPIPITATVYSTKAQPTAPVDNSASNAVSSTPGSNGPTSIYNTGAASSPAANASGTPGATQAPATPAPKTNIYGTPLAPQ